MEWEVASMPLKVKPICASDVRGEQPTCASDVRGEFKKCCFSLTERCFLHTLILKKFEHVHFMYTFSGGGSKTVRLFARCYFVDAHFIDCPLAGGRVLLTNPLMESHD